MQRRYNTGNQNPTTSREVASGMTQNWPEFFHKAISSLSPRIEEAMWAAGSREGWMQTEVMMFGRHEERKVFIYPNFEPISPGSRRKFDFAAYESDDEDAPLLAVAELKIMAGHFEKAWKCLTGGPAWPDWKDLNDGQRREVTRDEILSCDTPWGLVPDARRLIEFREARNDSVGAYLILVLLDLSEGSSPGAASVHRAMDAAQFSLDEYPPAPLRTKNCKVKVWTLN